MEVTVDASGVVQVLDEYLKRGGTLLPAAMLIVAHELVDAVHQKFDDEGPGWAPLAVSTVRQKGAASAILQDSGRFVGDIQADAGADFAEAFTSTPYAAYHVSGTSRMPRRDPFDLSEAMMERAAQTILAELLGP